MEYRINRRTGDKISVIGVGASSSGANGEKECRAVLELAFENGVNYYDLAKAGDELAADHYRNLEKKAGDCVQCGHCDSRCPFHVEQSKRMQEIQEYFGC